jgi:hypothetical protein
LLSAGRFAAIRNLNCMKAKTNTAAAKAAQQLRQAEHDAAATVAAVAEAASVRAMFAEDRKRFEKRYGVISMTTPD